jgi:hypothetical protein
VATYLPEDLRAAVEEADRGLCRYCLASELNTGMPLTYDHIHPRSKGGETSFENVCRACRPCNEFKSDATHALDPLTGEPTPLFNPRAEAWTTHFTWSADGTRVEGVSAVGRATIVALRMNRPAIITARGRWAEAGWHPPAERPSR